MFNTETKTIKKSALYTTIFQRYSTIPHLIAESIIDKTKRVQVFQVADNDTFSEAFCSLEYNHSAVYSVSFEVIVFNLGQQF